MGQRADALTNVALPEQESTETVVRGDDTVISIETDLGGLLYLINLAMYLNLYGDFTAPLAPGIELNIWDFVALIGSELVDDGMGDDTIWSLLANLAGRHGQESPGTYFSPAKEWRLPREWLLPFTNSDQKWKWSTHRGRLRVQHPEGFMVLDLPLAKDAGKQLEHEIEPYTLAQGVLARAPLHRLVPLRSTVTRRSVRRWLSLLMPYVRARLRAALDVESNDDIATVLCRRHAIVRASDTHVDVYFGLAELPLAIRVAGLDRDPGWVPAAGRFIAFHFN